jgi:hypothetical protein
MPRKKTFTLEGEAAGEFIRAQAGQLPTDDNERALRVATLVGLNLQTSPETAVALIKLVAREGLEAAAKVCTAAK